MSLNVDIKSNIHNRFDIWKENVETGVKEQVGYAENIVLDAMWSRLCGGSTYFVNIHYGTGTGSLSTARTSLFSYLGTGAAATVETVRAIPTSYWRRSITLGLTTANGNTLTEVGVAYGTGSTNLVTHAQIRDMNGNPIGIVKTDVDIITIYATVYITLINDHASIKLFHPNSNGLLSYLFGGSFPSAVFTAGMDSTEDNNPFGLYSYTIGSSGTGSWSADTANKKRKTSTMRFETTVSGNIKELAFSNIARLVLPASGIYSGLELSDVPLGTGDADKTLFDLPSAYIDWDSLVIKVDGNATAVSKESLEAYQRSSFVTPSNYGLALPKNNNALFIGVLPDGSYSSPKIFRYVDNYWREVFYDSTRIIVKAAAFTDDGNFFLLLANAWLKIYEFSGGTYVEIKHIATVASALYFDTMESKLYLAESSVLNIYDVNAEWELTLEDTIAGVPSDTSCIVLSPSKTKLITGYLTGYTLSILRMFEYQVDAWVSVTIDAVPGNEYSNGKLNAASFSHDETYLVVGHSKGNPSCCLYKRGATKWDRISTGGSGSCSEVKFEPNSYRLLAVTNALERYEIIDDKFVSIPKEVIFGYINTVGSRAVISENCKYLMLDASATYEKKNLMTQVEFSTPPAEGAVITADYTVNGIHKTDQRVIDVSGEIQFGEPS